MIEPTCTTMTAPPLLSARAHEDAAHTLVALTGLPVLTVRGAEDGAHLTVAGDGDLAEWLDALGGVVTVGVPHAGVRVWTLHTATGLRADGSRLPVLVHVVLPVGAELDADVLAAVAS